MTVELCLAGAGGMAELHALAAAAVPGASIAAVASRRRERAEDLAHRLGATACGLDELPAGAGAVVVVTPPADQVDRALFAVRAGAAVLLEKPLATTLAGADLLVQAEGADASITYAENLVHAPVFVDAQDLIAEPRWSSGRAGIADQATMRAP